MIDPANERRLEDSADVVRSYPTSRRNTEIFRETVGDKQEGKEEELIIEMNSEIYDVITLLIILKSTAYNMTSVNGHSVCTIKVQHGIREEN